MKRKGKKKLLIAVIALVLVAAIGAGIWFVSRSGGEPVNVYSFDYLGMTEYWGDSQESYGPVSTDKIQTVFLTDTQKVTEVLVSEGDMVKKGDVLMTFDTTLSDLQLQRKELEIERKKLQLSETRGYLVQLKKMEPYDPNYVPPVEEENLGTALTESYYLSTKTEFDGSSADKALICWLKDSTNIGSNLFEIIRQQAEEFQNENAMLEYENALLEAGLTIPSSASAAPETTVTGEPPVQTEGEIPSTETTQPPVSEPEGEPGPDTETQGPEIPTMPEYIHVQDYYVVFKVTQNNMSLGNRLQWQGVHVTLEGSTFHFQFFNPGALEDHTIAKSEILDPIVPDVGMGSGYTAAELKRMKAEQVKKIGQLELEIKMAQAEYKIMEAELTDGKVYADIDGKIVGLLSEEEAKLQGQPVMKVSGGGGFFIEGSVSELEKDNLKIGQEVTVNDWNTGMTYTGKVQSISDLPDSGNGWNGMGNPNASYYPFTVFVEEDADLQAGRYVSVTYSTSEGGNGIYLQNPFVRTENGRSFVYLRGEDGNLEKRFVTTGKSLWGSYTQILSGVTAEDYLAFPYGKDLKEGAPTVEADISELYNY